MNEEEYNNSLKEIENISISIKEELIINDYSIAEKSESTLNASDYCFVFLFGFLGAFLSTNKKLENYLAEIHHAASGVSGDYDKFQIMLGKLLYHKNSDMDLMQKRDGAPTNIGFHRLLWGHDIFSISGDNPFSLMIKQENSVIRGILKTLRHLVADTMSKQGLPSPGSSFLDYKYVDPYFEEEKMSNYLIDIVSNLSEEKYGNKAKSQEIFQHLFSIRNQDILGGMLSKALTECYLKINKVDNELKKAQIRFMVYAVDFFCEALIGAFKQKGIPYINIPVFGAMMGSYAKLAYIDYKETQNILKESDEVIKKADSIIEKYESQLKYLSLKETKESLINSIQKSEDNMNELINYLGEISDEENT